MSNRYREELSSLDDTIRWARRQDVGEVRSFIQTHMDKTLYAVGSGGSYSVAKYTSHLHEDVYQCHSQAITPYEVLTNPAVMRDSVVILISAGGNNSDILAALSHLREWDHPATASLCPSPSSQLVERCSEWSRAKVIDIGSPTINDGFLATHSLIAFGVLLSRAYGSLCDDPDAEDSQRENLLRLVSEFEDRESFERGTVALWQRDELIVLTGRAGVPAAVDIESKLSESAIMPVQVLDYRNFAHGRHNWLAKRGSRTAVLGISGPRDNVLARRTHERLPDSVAQKRIVLLDDGAKGILAGLICGLYIVEAAADEAGVDAGNPRIPPFGRRIYNLKTIKYAARKPDCYSPPVRRKLEEFGCGVGSPPVAIVSEAFRRFLDCLEVVLVKGVVFDYDGTLCSNERRFEGLERHTAERLEGLLDSSIRVGVVSGRGGSMGEDLRKVIGESYWKSLMVGYYNASVVAALAEKQDPSELTNQSGEALERMVEAVEESEVADLVVESSRHRGCQFTLFPKASLDSLFRIIDEIRMTAGLHNLRLVMSTHSVDVIPANVSKRRFVGEFCRRHDISPENVLRIGDRGDRQGNDFEFLSEFPALSVDRVSGSLKTCWNLGHLGRSGLRTTMLYLDALELGDGVARLRTSALKA